MKTYGRITRDESAHWNVDCEPHVRLRFKRFFWRSNKQHGEIKIKDTDEVCRDLLWFIDRYPMEMSIDDREYLEKKACEYDERIELYNKILSGSMNPRDFKLAFPPRPYQAIATELLLRSGGLLVADDLGLGKTVVGISAVSDHNLRPSLVVVPTHLQVQWANEFQKFLPGIKTHILKKGTPYDLTKPLGRRRKKRTSIKRTCLKKSHSFQML